MAQEPDEESKLHSAYCEAMEIGECGSSEDCAVKKDKCLPVTANKHKFKETSGLFGRMRGWRDGTGTSRENAIRTLRETSLSRTKLSTKDDNLSIAIPQYGLLYVKPKSVIIAPTLEMSRIEDTGFWDVKSTYHDSATVTIPPKYVKFEAECSSYGGKFKSDYVIAFCTNDTDWECDNTTGICVFKEQSLVILSGQDIYEVVIGGGETIMLGSELETIGYTGSIYIRRDINNNMDIIKNRTTETASVFYKMK